HIDQQGDLRRGEDVLGERRVELPLLVEYLAGDLFRRAGLDVEAGNAQLLPPRSHAPARLRQEQKEGLVLAGNAVILAQHKDAVLLPTGKRKASALGSGAFGHHLEGLSALAVLLAMKNDSLER